MGTAYLPYPSTYVGKIDDDYEISGWTRSERASGSLSLFPYYQVDGPLETDTGNGILALHSCDLRRLPAGTWRNPLITFRRYMGMFASCTGFTCTCDFQNALRSLAPA